MAAYIDDGTDQELLTPEVASPPETLQGLRNYVETYLRQIREDMLKVTGGNWRIVMSGNNLVVQQYQRSSQTWVERYKIEGRTTIAFEDGTPMNFEDGTEAKYEDGT